MAGSLFDQISSELQRGLEAQPRPLFPGAVWGIDDGHRRMLSNCGYAYRYAAEVGSELPAAKARRMHEDTIFDLASLTKLFTAAATMRLVEQRLLTLDDPLARYFPDYAGGAKAAVTIRQLLTHTSGLPAEIALWRDFGDVDSRRTGVLRQPLEVPPGSRSLYSCVGFITLGFLIERLFGTRLDAALDELVFKPVGMTRTGYLPLNRVEPDDIAATEVRPITWTTLHQPAELDGRGVVHDENAASLGGVSGNAGVFGPAIDLLRFGRALLDGLAGESSALGLSRPGTRQLVTPQLPPDLCPGYQSGLGFRVDDVNFMGRLAGNGSAYGHTGFTGTSIVIDEARNVVLVLLTNRVHPSRTWSLLNPARERVSDLVADHYRAIPVATVCAESPAQAAWP
jgi:CubicO group peptidase (beta-lactamase class C family)